MNETILIKALCLGVLGAPGIIAATAGLTVPPEGMAMIGVASIIAGSILSELKPGKGGPGKPESSRLSAADRRAVANDLEARMKRTPAREEAP